MFIEKWVIAIVIIMIFSLLILLWKSQKQVRALRFCFMHFSDAMKREIDESEYLLERPDGEVIAGIMKRFNRTWGSELDWTRDVMSRVSLRWFSMEDKLYVLED